MNRFNLLTGAAVAACLSTLAAPAAAQNERMFDIPPGALGEALTAFATQADQQILFTPQLVDGLRSPGVNGRLAPYEALDRLLEGSGLEGRQIRPGVFALRRAAPEPVTELEALVVTGTLLVSSGDLASPVVTMDRDELDRRGYGTVAEVLAAMPQNYAGTSTPLTQATGADVGTSNNVYATGVNLRGLGPSATLVLVNGRRLAGTGSRAEFADISALPSAAVERVDVLLDGASALYGADAVAGVVNVIMRRAYHGHESRLRVAAAQGGAEDVQLSHLAGRRWGSGSAYLSYEHQSANGLSASDRAYTADGDLRPFGGTDRRSFYSAPGNIVAFDPATSAYQVLWGIRPAPGGTAQGPEDFAAGDANLQSPRLGVDLLPALERHSAYGQVRQTLGERLELSADLRYSRRKTENATVPAAGVFTVTQANPWFVSPTGAAAHSVAYSFVRDLGPAQNHALSESIGGTLGARYDLPAGWLLEGYVAEAVERADYGVSNRVNATFLAEALGNVPDNPATPFRAEVDGYFNLFGDGAANSPAVLEFIGSGYGQVSNRSRASAANLMVQGPLWRLPAGDLKVALGAQVRSEAFETRGETFLAGIEPRLMATPERERSVTAVFAEARVPLVAPAEGRPGVRALDLSLAARQEAYDDFGSTTNPKVGIVWEPVEGLGVRASWGTSFRAGALPQLFDQQGVSPAFLSRADGSEALILMVYGGNPDLRPETSETFTAGFDYRSAGGSSLSVNLFETRFDDRIAQPVNANFEGALIDPTLSPFVTLIDPANNPADLALVEGYADTPGFSPAFPAESYGAIVDTRWVNTGAVRVRGLDLTARHSWPLQSGDLALETAASWIIDYESRATPAAPAEQVAGLLGYPVRLRARTGLSWSGDGVDLGAYWNHVAAYEDRAGTRIDPWDTLDARVAWRPVSGPLDGLSVELAVQNLFDEAPPFYDSPTGFGFDAGQASLLGRIVSLHLIKRW
ncbi:TonB-dependent receptor [Brevundimonas sp.]|uniref:TonB-dependent receptor n=1 Tax=Brevundimonas sp. TaxID=1871086 RepID=UPI001D1FDEBD|nr:TonB-dependent receptor [Brevundimonas sp.]MBA4001087.1 TonB-dependent receptor [Brevundimonas sp.]